MITRNEQYNSSSNESLRSVNGYYRSWRRELIVFSF